ncbi:MAG: PspA-associated protein PspAA [Actinomycetes bacterium]
MIVRILGEGQREVPDAEVDALNPLDDALAHALEHGDESEFREALTALLDRVRQASTPVADDALVPSDLVLPAADSSVEEVTRLLGEEGLIPG